MVKREQDEAYRLSLEADRKKVHTDGHFVVSDRVVRADMPVNNLVMALKQAGPTHGCCCHF